MRPMDEPNTSWGAPTPLPASGVEGPPTPPITGCSGETPASSPVRSIQAGSSAMVGDAPSSSSLEVSLPQARFSYFCLSFFCLSSLAFFCTSFATRFAAISAVVRKGIGCSVSTRCLG